MELCRAEAAYAANKARRVASFNGLLQPAVLSVADMLTKAIVPMYPCPREQRLGVWGEGGKVRKGDGWKMGRGKGDAGDGWKMGRGKGHAGDGWKLGRGKGDAGDGWKRGRGKGGLGSEKGSERVREWARGKEGGEGWRTGKAGGWVEEGEREGGRGRGKGSEYGERDGGRWGGSEAA
ncbi:unnamed protein product, partial [Closterium sp. Naga37s-1]